MEEYDGNGEELTIPTKQERSSKRFFRGAGISSLVVTGGLLSILFYILQFVFVASIGLGVFYWAISLFMEGAIIGGLLVLFIVTPLAIGLASWAFWFLFIVAVLALIIWGVTTLFGLNLSFDNIWDIIWFVLMVFLLGGMAFFGISEFIEATRRGRVSDFFRDYWFGILLFFFLFWLFFIN